MAGLPEVDYRPSSLGARDTDFPLQEPLIGKRFDGVPVKDNLSAASPSICSFFRRILCCPKEPDEMFTSGGSESTARRPSSAASVHSIDQALFDMGFTEGVDPFEDEDLEIPTFGNLVPASPAATVIHHPVAQASPRHTGNAKESPSTLTL